MQVDIKEYIRNLTAVTAERERIGAELNIATQIQTGMLPCTFPAFPDIREIDIYASMVPAKEVGGDFYDFVIVGLRYCGCLRQRYSRRSVYDDDENPDQKPGTRRSERCGNFYHGK